MNNALLYFGGILITALAVLFAVPRFVDWTSYRGVFEEEASRVLGRQVRVGGAVNVRLLPAPFVSFERLRIADTGDDGGTSIIRVESFTMWLSVPPLLRGVLEAHRVDIRRPVVSLTTNDQGGGNWRTLAFSTGSFRFVPKEVALQSVQIHEGAIVISGPQRNELARLDAISGELTAEALEGPFKFKGNATWEGTLRQIKLATSKLDDNGVLRFKTAIDVPETANSYVFDGTLSNIKDKPSLAGDLTAKFALAHAPRPAPVTAADPIVDSEQSAAPAPGGPPAASPTPPSPAPAPADGRPRSFELKAKLSGSTTGAKLDDIAVSLEAGTTPQLITGSATFDWKDRTQLDVALASRWLDLDQIAPPDDKKTPLEAGRGYFEALAAALPQQADTNARLEFDQLTLGGEPISNVRLAASRSGGPLELKGVRADLPGGVRLELDGILTPSAKTPRLDGSLFVSGKSLLRFLAWGFENTALAQDRNDGAFSLDGKFALGDNAVALTDVAFEFSGTPLDGDIKIDLGDQKRLAIAIEGPRIDVAQIGPGLVGLTVLRELLLGSGTGEDKGAPAAGSQLLDPKTADLSLDLKVAELVDGARILTNVDTSIRLERGALSISRLNFSTPEGLTVEADGNATDVPANPKGAIRGLVSAPTAEAARAFIALLDADSALASDLDRIATLAPFRVAGLLRLSGAPQDASSLSLDGTAGQGHITATMRLDGGRSKWRTSPFDLDLSLDNSDVPLVLSALTGAKPTRASGSAPLIGRVVLKASGTPAEGMLALADASADGLSLSYRGKLRLPSPQETGLDGNLQITANDSRDVLMLAGLANANAPGATALSGQIHVRREGAALKLSSDAMTVGASVVSGEVALTSGDDGRQKIDAKIATNKTSFASLLWPVLGKATEGDMLNVLTPPAPVPARTNQRTPAGAPAVPAVQPVIVWPEQTFDLSALEKTEATVDIKMTALEVEPGLTIRNARLQATLNPATITVSKLTGEAVGGRLISNLDLTKAAAGVDLSGALRIDIDGKPLGPDMSDPPPPGDAAAFGVTFSSRALSPAALIAALNGRGEITIGDATLAGNSPAAVSAIARAAMTGQGPNSGTALADAIRDALKTGEVRLGKLTIPVEMSDGALKLERVRIDMKEGRSTFTTAIELATMKIDSEWQIEPRIATTAGEPSSDQGFLPPVTVVYTGKLSQFSDLVPVVSAGALERELVVRKMELDVGELERLRKLDEQRARDDAARRKAQDEERARIEAERQKALEADQTAPEAAPAPQPGTDPSAQPNATPGPGDVYDDTAVRPPQDPALPDGQQAATPPPAATTQYPAAQRPRKKRPADEEWRPFQTPF